MFRCLALAVACVLSQPIMPVYYMTVSVADSRGRAVAGLTVADVTVKIGQVDRVPSAVEPDLRPLSIVVIVDGVEPTEVLDARAALASVLRRLRGSGEDVRIGLILGDQGARIPALEDAQAAASDHDRRVSRLFQAPQTATPPDTISAAVEALAREEGRRRAVLVMSVNRRQSVAQSFESVITAMRRADVTLAAVETGRGRDQSLWLIHSAVGGRFERVSDVAAHGSVATRLAGALLSAYRVSFPANESASSTLEVQIKGRDRLTVIAAAWGVGR